jgi:hypothetical protein
VQTSELIIQPATTSRDTVIVGAVAGIAAGVAMSFWAVLTSIWHGVGLLSSFELIGATFMGSGPVGTGLGMILYGFLVHTLMSAALGILFTLLLPKDISCRQACAGGVAYGLAVMLAMTFVITPIVNPVMREAVTLFPKSWLIQHALFGVALGLVPLLWRQCGDESVRVRMRPRQVLVPQAAGNPLAFEHQRMGKTPGNGQSVRGAMRSLARRAVQPRVDGRAPANPSRARLT